MGDRTIASRRGVLLACLLLVATNLRPAIASVSPILEQIRASLGLGYTAMSLLTVIPTLSMGVFAFATPVVARRLGRERGTFWATLLVGVATLARVWSANVFVLFATTIGVSVGIAVAQTLLPGLVGTYFPDRAGVVTGLYMAALIGGSALASAFTAPIADALGSWPAALAVWGLLALVTAPLWRYVTPDRTTTTHSTDGDVTLGNLPLHSSWAWLLSLFLVGVVLVYFAELTWLAPLYVALGWTSEQAGYLLTVSILGQVAGALVVSAGSLRFADRRPLLVVALVASTVGLAGVTVAPEAAPWTWAVVMGLGIGGAAAVAFTLPVDYAADADTAGRVSAMVLGVGYLGGGAGPLVIGWMRDNLGGYYTAFLTLTIVSALLLALSVIFQPGREIRLE